ncbi:MAG: hypothetical protein K0A89_02030 [ANME-2 cluster archaeon]|nr:hypothetical protein [ANME-2 cluster archaeon]
MNTSRYIFLLTIGIAVISIGTADALTRSGEWEAASLVSDNRIPAGSNITEDHEIRLPQGNAGPVRVIV